MSAIATFVLAGGKSTRMGSDKAFLELGGRTLLSRAIEVARGISDDVRIVGDPAKFAAFGPVVQDLYPDRGPLGGIHAALSGSSADLNLILAVDLPFLNAPVLRYLISRAGASGAVVTVPIIEGRYQPLCGVYRKEFAAIAESALAQGNNKIDALFPAVSVCIIYEQELTAAGFSAKAFRNVNTPEDWEQAKREIESPLQHLS